MVHALNNAMQTACITHAGMQAILRRDGWAPPPRGDYHVGELQHVLRRMDPSVTLHEGIPHLGHTAGNTLMDTLALQPHTMTDCDSIILTLHPPAESRCELAPTHHVAAMRMRVRQGGPEWLLLDSIHPGPACVPAG